MRFLTAVFLAVAALAAPVLSAPAAPRDIQKSDKPPSGKYIVTLKDSASQDSVLRRAGVNVTNSWTIINGFAGKFSPEALEVLRSHPDVKDISEDGIARASFTQNDAPWGLSRVSSILKLADQNPNHLNFTYNYAAAGDGVDVYVIDTGIRITHQQFVVDRAKWGANFVPESPDTDENGHGTHCAGTVAGTRYGVAKEATVIAVKVLDKDGLGFITDIIEGLQYVANAALTSGRPSIASISIGASPNTALDDAVRAVIARGIHITVSAGNSNTDARNQSPARVAEAVTVAASTIADTKASFSNFGPGIDVFAPGQHVISSWFTSDTATAALDGTSMATPHVAGFIASYIELRGNLSPEDMSNKIKELALPGVLSGVPPGTPNLLLNNIRA